MTRFLQWTVPQVCSLAGQVTNAVLYLPRVGGFALHDGAKVGNRIALEKEKKIAKIYKEVEPYAPEIDSLVIMSTNCQRSAQSAIDKLRAL